MDRDIGVQNYRMCQEFVKHRCMGRELSCGSPEAKQRVMGEGKQSKQDDSIHFRQQAGLAGSRVRSSAG
jgi:hypothetical protein